MDGVLGFGVEDLREDVEEGLVVQQGEQRLLHGAGQLGDVPVLHFHDEPLEEFPVAGQFVPGYVL